ncbi:MAG: hypothetical protein VX916_06440 [Planctomycetota bacterium]|nr:hypothetical protein [Planctomycetota bacterium]
MTSSVSRTQRNMSGVELRAKLASVSPGDLATLFFIDGGVVRGPMLYNAIQGRGVIIDPEGEAERRFEANEVARVWRR